MYIESYTEPSHTVPTQNKAQISFGFIRLTWSFFEGAGCMGRGWYWAL